MPFTPQFQEAGTRASAERARARPARRDLDPQRVIAEVALAGSWVKTGPIFGAKGETLAEWMKQDHPAAYSTALAYLDPSRGGLRVHRRPYPPDDAVLTAARACGHQAATRVAVGMSKESFRRMRAKNPALEARLQQIWGEAREERRAAAKQVSRDRARAGKVARGDAGPGRTQARRDARYWVPVLRHDPCCYCGTSASDTSEADHIVAWRRGGAVTWENLTASCRSCNRKKHAMSLLHFLLRRKS